MTPPKGRGFKDSNKSEIFICCLDDTLKGSPNDKIFHFMRKYISSLYAYKEDHTIFGANKYKPYCCWSCAVVINTPGIYIDFF